MHEAAIAQAIIEQVERRITSGALPPRIEAIHLRIGKLTAVVPENLAFMFDVLQRGTRLEPVRLIIEEVPVRCYCNVCGDEFTMQNEIDFHCPRCGAYDVELLSGRELIIEKVEVPDGNWQDQND